MKVFYFSVFFVTLLCGCTTPSVAPMEPLRFSLFSRPFFVQKNERVTFDFLFKEGIQGAEDCSYRAVLMRPHQPYEKLLPHGVDTHFCFRVGEQERDGFYVATGYILEKRNEKPLLRGIAKRSFLCGRIIADFLHIPSLPDKATKEYLNGYLKQFKSLGGNLLIADSLVTSERAFYPSNVCRSRVVPEHDFLLEVLEGCDREGIAVLLSLPWDVSADLPHSTRLASLEKIMYELYLNYGAHPSFCGYYSHLTGGSLDYALYIRTFTKLVKSLDDGLLTACSPYLEDPLLAGYLASIEWLDIILPQTRFSASRLPSDGRFLPVRRAADYIKCFAGASSRKKLLLPRIELFSPSQETALSESDVKGQILAVSSVGNLNGIALYSYHRDVYPLLAAKGEKMEKALQDALTAFNVIQSEFSSHPTIAIYYPSSGRLRSANSLFDSLDSLRRKGISSGVVVFVPPSRESLSPFPPTMADEEMVRSLAESARVILLCDVVALSESDCSFINEALSSGATLVVSGFPLPTGTALKQDSLFGVEGAECSKTALLSFRYDLGDFLDREKIELGAELQLPFLLRRGGIPVLGADEQRMLVQLVPFAEGRLYITTLSVEENREPLSAVFVQLLKDAVAYAKGEEMPVVAAPLPSDVELNYCWKEGTLTILLINYADKQLETEFYLPKRLSEGCLLKFLNVVEAGSPVELKKKTKFKISILPSWYVMVKLVPLALK